ncbi:hypothetical protein [Sphaerisporangium sp. NPDC051011]|uniref:hypothetical protein n=1 Tax=Sphaerisporangium sp. NPDC051011 TaxID=3155792 RepID=UPI0033CF7A2B
MIGAVADWTEPPADCDAHLGGRARGAEDDRRRAARGVRPGGALGERAAGADPPGRDARPRVPGHI